MLKRGLAIAAGFLSMMVLAASANPLQSAWEALSRRQYLLALSHTQELGDAGRPLRAQLLNFLGAYQEAEALYGDPNAIHCAAPSRQETRSLAEIAGKAENVDVFIINEHHEIARHRAQLALLLPQLAKLGYDTLAAETFTKDVERDHGLYGLRVTDGVYSDEPTFRLLTDTARSLGMQLAAYEQTAGNLVLAEDGAENRERVQAHNLAKLVRSGHKVVVLSGRGHLRANDQSPPAPTHLMGWHVEHSEGLRVVRVSQLDCAASEVSSSPKPIFFQNADSERRGVDFFMLPAPNSAVRLLRVRGLHGQRVNNTFGKGGRTYVAEVRRTGEDRSMVPLHRSIVRGDSDFIVSVPKRAWRLEVYDPEGNVVYDTSAGVEK